MSKLQEFLDDFLKDFGDKNGYIKFGSEIRRMRNEKQMSQIELSKKTGISQSCLSNIEKGKYNLSVKQIAKIAEGLGCRIIFKLEEENER